MTPASGVLTAKPADPAAAATGAGRGTAPGDGRLAALDGLRGIAAVVVLLHHTLEVAAPHLRDRDGAAGALWWLLTETPVKALTAGGEAVVLFFVLSGLVVALPALRRRGFSWPGFLASRFVRIMLPVWAALGLAAALILLIPRDPAAAPPGSWLADNNATSLSGALLLEEATLSRYSYDINNVLWSLRWELMFAFLLPLFLVLARASARWWLPTGCAALLVATLGFALGDGTLSYLPAFFVGTLMAVRLTELQAWGVRHAERRWFAVVWPLAMGLALLAFVAPWIAAPLLTTDNAVVHDMLRALSILASICFIGAAITVPAVARTLTRRIFAWLGRISFSLYLVHVPIIVAVSYLFGAEDWKVALLVAVPLSVGAAHAFWRFVEKPSHAAARAAARRFPARADHGAIERSPRRPQ